MVGVAGLTYHSLQLDVFLNSEKASWNSTHEWFGVLYGYFLLTSWMLILVIAIDRCIHMTYPYRYSTLITKCRARIILFLSIVFCILVRPPSVLTSEPLSRWLRFARYILYTVGTFGVFVIYVVLYFLIKRRVISMQTCKVGQAEVQDTPGSGTNYQHAGSCSQLCYGCSRMKRCKKINAVKNLHNHKICMVLREKNDQKVSHKENVPSPVYNADSRMNFGDSNEEFMCREKNSNCEIDKLKLDQQQEKDDRKMTKQSSDYHCKLLNAENSIKCPNVIDKIRPTAPVGSDLFMQTHAIRQPNDFIDHQDRIGVANNAALFTTERKQCNEGMINAIKPMSMPDVGERVKKASRRWNTPDEEVKKVTWLIFIALSISYVPSMINFFHLHATGIEIAAISFIAHISVLFNSSLNAIILIACSKDIQRKLKAMFTRS